MIYIDYLNPLIKKKKQLFKLNKNMKILIKIKNT